jgi:phosphoribosylamine---glycine ligase
MKVLVVGAGGREHALCWSLKQSPSVEKVLCCPGSDAILKFADVIPIQPLAKEEISGFAASAGIDLVVIGPEAPLAGGLSDELRRRGIPVFGPSRAAARLESSKVYAKQFMERHGIPTARCAIFDAYDSARRFLESREMGFPVVIKADGLAAGKGVSVCPDANAALAFLSRVMIERAFGSAGERIVVEECLGGEEISYMVLCDGRKYVPLVASQDHKRLLDGDQGPNTGGMGAYSTDGLLSDELTNAIESHIIGPVLQGMSEEGTPFQGVLYAGVMLTRDGPKVLEFNVRLGDPETQPVLMRFSGDLGQVLAASSRGELAADLLCWHRGAALCVVLAAAGYPESPRTGDTIDGLEGETETEGFQIFHAGTQYINGHWQTAGGRILGITARGSSLAEASKRAYGEAAKIHFAGMQYRMDIGAKGLQRL